VPKLKVDKSVKVSAKMSVLTAMPAGLATYESSLTWVGTDADANNLIGGTGADTITGDAGADTITGGANADILTGGADADIYKYNAIADRQHRLQ
jgi:Ca2+-binding RTX toxin-like protein